MVPRSLAVLAALLLALFVAPAAFGAEAADIDQCENGPLDAPHPCAFSLADADPWVNGNLNGSKAHYREDEVVPFRIKLTGLTAGSNNTITIEWDTLKGGKHAYDFIYNFNYTEKTADPCVGIAGCSLGSASYKAIPKDPTVSPASMTTGMPNSGSGHDRETAMFGGPINAITAPSHPGGTDDPARATASFHTTVSTAALA